MRFNPIKIARQLNETKILLAEAKEATERANQEKNNSLTALHGELTELRKELREAHELLTIIHERYEKDVRIGSVRISTADIQAKCRGLVSNVKIEGPLEPQLWVIKADEELPEADLNAIRAQFQSMLEIDRT